MKRVLTAIFFILVSFVAHAEIYLGARYGGALSTVFFRSDQNEKVIFTPVNAAVAFRYCNEGAQDYERYMNFLWEFGYGQRGYNLGDSAVVKFRSRVLEMPVMMQARIPVVKHVNVLITGIIYGTYYMKTDRIFHDESGVKVTEPYSYNSHFDYGVGGGLGLCLSFGKLDFTLDARYMAGMKYLIKPTVDLYESMPMQVIFSFGVMRKIGN